MVPQPSGCGCRDPRVAAATIFGSWLQSRSSGCGATAFGLWLSRHPGGDFHDLGVVAPATVFGLWRHSLRAVAVATPGSRPPRSSDRGSCHSLRAVVPQSSGCGCRDPRVAAATIFGSWLLPQSSGSGAIAFGLWPSRPSGRGRHDLRIVAPATVFGLWCHSLWAVHSLRGCGATVFGLRPSRPSGRGCHDLRIVASATVSGLWCHSFRVVAVATSGSRPPRSSDRGSCHSFRALVPQLSGCGCHDLRVAAVP